MCITIIEKHLCGQERGEIECFKCHWKSNLSMLLRSIIANGREPTVEEETNQKRLEKECIEASNKWDEVMIDTECEACTAEVNRLGWIEARIRCVRSPRPRQELRAENLNV